MKTLHAWCLGLAVGLLGLPAGFSAPAARASAAGTSAAGASAAGGVAIRKIQRTGPNTRLRTPIFTTDTSENIKRNREWVCLSVTYDTEPDWIDELEVRYMVLVKHPKTGAYTMFPATVTYQDVAKGKGHTSTVFLRPQTVERYGAVDWVGVRMFAGGQQVAIAQDPNDKSPWTASIKTVEKVLLNRSQTPFFLIGYDNFETIKPQ